MLRGMWVIMAVLISCTTQAQEAREKLDAEAGRLTLNDPLQGTFRATLTSSDDQTDLHAQLFSP